MTPWEARDVLRERDPQRALRAHAVDPLPDPPKPCTCADEDKIEFWNLSSAAPKFICGGRCR